MHLAFTNTAPWLVTATWMLQAAAITPPCQLIAPNQTNLTTVRTAEVNVTKFPFAVTYATLQNDIAFVSLAAGDGNSTIGVLNTSSFAPTLMHEIPLPKPYVTSAAAFGMALGSKGHHLYVAAGQGLIILSTEKAAAGDADAVIGAINGTTSNQDPGDAAIEITLSRHDAYAFVSQEYGRNRSLGIGNIDVFKLNNLTANNNGSDAGYPVGFVDLGLAVVGTTLSPDGDKLYAVSEIQSRNSSGAGILSVLDVATLKKDPAEAVSVNVTAGCQPVRVITSSDGQTVWVTARGSNYLLGYNATKLESDPNNALIASVQVGTQPVGLTFVRNETRILTADSSRSMQAGAVSGISVVDVQAALNGSDQAVLGSIPTGFFPRQFAVSPDGSTVLVSVFDSMEVQAIDVASLP